MSDAIRIMKALNERDCNTEQIFRENVLYFRRGRARGGRWR